MAHTFFLIGHGIQYMTESEQTVPDGVTVRFAVPAGWLSTGGVSTRHLSGELTDYAETVPSGGKYNEHFLCPDFYAIHERKLNAFVGGRLAEESWNWIVAARGRSEVALSAIIARLRAIVTPPVTIVWTCCRAPINEVARGTVEYDDGRLVEKPCDGDKAATRFPLAANHNVFRNDATGVLTVLESREIRKRKVERYGISIDKWKIGSDRKLYDPASLFGDMTSDSKLFGAEELAF